MPTGGEHPEVDIQNLGLPDKTKSVKNWNMSYNYRKNKRNLTKTYPKKGKYQSQTCLFKKVF